jgi:hypothetical protein
MRLLSLIVLGLSVSLLSTSANAAGHCPEFLLTRLVQFNQHLVLEKQGMPGEFQEDFDYVTGVFAADPSMINCTDADLGDTPLTFSLNTLYNLCSLPEAASYLIAHGAIIDMPEASENNTPLFYAVKAYGSIYGTPDPIELRNDFCSEDAPQAPFVALIKTLIQRGADINHVGSYGAGSPQDVARDLKVTELFQ